MLILLACAFDLLDGLVARVNSKESVFGAFLDSTLDRYGDAALFLGCGSYFYRQGDMLMSSLCMVALVGALLVSYVRARAEAMGVACTVGLMERPERILLLALGALTGWLRPVMWILAVLTHITVIQRIMHVRRALEPNR